MPARLLRLLIFIVCLALFTSLTEVTTAASPAPRRVNTHKAGARTPLGAGQQAALVRGVRHELVTLPCVRSIKGVSRVVYKMEVLPLSPDDERAARRG